MELDELLEREGQDPDELMTWAKTRVEQLLAELVGQSDELARLLEPASQIDLDAMPVRRVAVAEDPVSAPPSAAAPAAEVIAEPTSPIELPQPLSAAELPPPPEHPRLADGEPEPMLEHVDTGPIDLDSAEGQAMIGGHSTQVASAQVEAAAEAASEVSSEMTSEAASEMTSEAASEDREDPDDFEIDTELEELDDEELELVEVEDEDEDETSSGPDVAPPPPPPPPPRRPPAQAKAPPPPPKSDNSVDIDGLLAELKGGE